MQQYYTKAFTVFIQTQEILERLQNHVVRQLTVENCLEYFSKTVEYGMNDLRTKIVRYINWHFIDVASQKEWLELSSSTVNTIISSNVLNIEREEDLYEAIWAWYNHDKLK